MKLPRSVTVVTARHRRACDSDESAFYRFDGTHDSDRSQAESDTTLMATHDVNTAWSGLGPATLVGKDVNLKSGILQR
jgi:hypothetical protein